MLNNINTDEERREHALQALRSADEIRDEVLRKFVRLASQSLAIPGSFISVLDDEMQYIRAAHNFSLKRSSRQDSLCRHVVDGNGVVIVPDTHLDPRFAEHPLITGAPYIRFYAGVALKNREGVRLGTLCVTDTSPQAFSAAQLNTLQLLSTLVMSFLEAWHSAGFIDPVTELPNRQRLIRDLQYLAEAGDTTRRRLVLIDCIDMPRAYELARSMGMGPVESLLRDMATLIPLRLRLTPGDMLYTVATGRFALLTRADGPLNASWVVSRLAGISADLEEGLSVALTTHSGEAEFIASEVAAQEVLRRAVSALHEAIGLGVPSLPFSEVSDTQRTRDFRLMNDLTAALRENIGLYLVYQPKVRLQDGMPVGLEALIRWRHPTHGELSPAAFIPLAEQTELLGEVTAWVINSVILRLTALGNSVIQLPITINVSVRDFSQKGFAERLESRMTKAGLSTALLGIECLETERIIESSAALQGLEMLKLKGFGISLDDFGTGYSNVSYLRRMPLDVIKLDRSLISDLSVDTASRVIVRSIITMLKELDYVVLAEGVENEEDATVLLDYGCDLAQGYFYSKPLAGEALNSWLSWKLRDRG
ncbi:EAL domain-containing protein [Duffyella gerundensis]|uniref:EAL domain-containing protein n=1 Tax=Duffyella TaxID=3026546 RepID=UPI003F6DC614